MKKFLEYVAEDIIRKHGTNLSRTAVVFPNKRASLFMNKYLMGVSKQPMWSPAYITISDLFRGHSELQVPDQLKLICDLHKCFTEITKMDESLDHFYGWGQLMISDFDDIDKNMADARLVFANMSDLHEYDDLSYLTEEQVDVIKHFFQNFSGDKNSVLKERFQKLWSHFYDIYVKYNETLEKNGLAYEGALYRKVATDESIEFKYDNYIFVGFNMIQKVEVALFDRLKKAGKAEFYWDFDHYYMPKKNSHNNEAGHYIASFLEMFPNSLDINNSSIYNNFNRKKQITLISSTTETIQARYASNWLKEDKRTDKGENVAVVMCNENVLPTVIHSLPEEISNVNITTGYPLIQTPIASFVKLLMTLRIEGYNNRKHAYSLRFINNVLNHPYTHFLSDNYTALVDEINVSSKIYYPTFQQLAKDDALEILFSNPYSCLDQNVSFELSMTEWIIKVIAILAERTKDNVDDPLYKESLFKTYTLLNRVKKHIACGDLNVSAPILCSIINQMIQTTAIPFHGEPAIGLQVMGVLETRNLDFTDLLILSCNEGNMPKGVNDVSFIPYSIRKAFGLTTIDNKVAIYAYYFYRLLQRAENITILYNNATTDGNKAELSRFVLQLLVESGHEVVRKSLCPVQEFSIGSPQDIDKTEEVMNILHQRFDKALNPEKNNRALLSPSAINLYLRCPLRFYYNYVSGIKEPDLNDEDKIDGRIFGIIFHYASQKLYEQMMDGDGWVSPEIIGKMLKSPTTIERAVDESFNVNLFNTTSHNARDYDGLQLINREVVIIYLRRLLENDMKLGRFKILGLERQVLEDMVVKSGEEEFTTSVGGIIDRLDMIRDNGKDYIRVVDYKTGANTELKKIDSVDALFENSVVTEKHGDYYIQTMLYSKIVSDSGKINKHCLPVSPALLFIQKRIENSDEIVLKLAGAPIDDIATHKDTFMSVLTQKVNEIFNPSVPFYPIIDSKKCSYCPYSGICGI